MKPSRSDFITLRGLRHHVRIWGKDDAPRLFVLHGWMDVSASFQFLVDALERDWQVIAPDLRGYGQSQHGGDIYWYGDFLGDLDRLLHHYQPEAPVNLLGHSFGGSLACTYAGLRPDRVQRLVNLDAYGPRSDNPAAKLKRWRRWLRLTEKPLRAPSYASREEFEQRLREAHPRIARERLAFVARHWAEEKDGRIRLLHDPVHAFDEGVHLGIRLEEAMAAWREVSAETLILLARQGSAVTRATDMVPGFAAEDRFGCFRNSRRVWLEDCGHMLHLEHPEALAPLIERFLIDGLQSG